MTLVSTHGITGENVTALTYHGFVNYKAKPGQDILSSLTPEKCHLLHMAIGVVGEVGELFEAEFGKHILEECGDIEFFLQGMTLNGSGIGSYEYHESPRVKIVGETAIKDRMVVAAANLMDVIKKHAIYNKPLDFEKANHEWHILHNLLDTIYAGRKWNRQMVIAANVDKLNKRYEKQYSDAEAQQRADKKEGE